MQQKENEKKKKKKKRETNCNDQRTGRKKEKRERKRNERIFHLHLWEYVEREKKYRKRKTFINKMKQIRWCNINDQCSFGFIIIIACLRINKFAHTYIKCFTVEKSIEQEKYLFTFVIGLTTKTKKISYASSWLTIGILADCRVKRDFNRSSFSFGITLQLGDHDM